MRRVEINEAARVYSVRAERGEKSHPDGQAQLQLLEEACCMSYREKRDCYKLK